MNLTLPLYLNKKILNLNYNCMLNQNKIIKLNILNQET